MATEYTDVYEIRFLTQENRLSNYNQVPYDLVCLGDEFKGKHVKSIKVIFRDEVRPLIEFTHHTGYVTVLPDVEIEYFKVDAISAK